MGHGKEATMSGRSHTVLRFRVALLTASAALALTITSAGAGADVHPLGGPAGNARHASLAVTGGQLFASASRYAGLMQALSPGATLWSARASGSGRAVAVSSDGDRIFVTGSDTGSTPWATEFSTHSYEATTGKTLWSSRYTGPGLGQNVPTAMTVRGSNMVYVTGYSVGGLNQLDFVTVAYNASTGAQVSGPAGTTVRRASTTSPVQSPLPATARRLS
jgi:outer membrane protein assembly factor BamB